MVRLPLPTRIVAVVLTAILSLTGPGAAVAHGVAHVREHRVADHHEADDHHAPHLLEPLVSLVHGHEHADAPAAAAHEAIVAPAPSAHSQHVAASGDASSSHEAAVVREAENGESHGHPRLAAQAISRLTVGALLPALPTLVPVAPVIVATMAATPAASPLRLAEPPTGPPPPSRAPPLG
jgi:hypothetical protein